MGEPNVPAEWAALMEPRGVHSANALAQRAGVATSTITRLFQGGASTEATLEAIAQALDVPITKVRKVAGHQAGLNEPFVLPAEANRLSRRQRALILEMVAVLIDVDDTAKVTSLSDRAGRPRIKVPDEGAASRKRGGGRDKGDDPRA